MVASGIKLGLTDAGYAVDWVGSGERAEEVLKTEVFDAAIIDIGLPQHGWPGADPAPAPPRNGQPCACRC